MKPGDHYYPASLDQKLGYLAEEAGEVLAALGKSQRWGLDSYNPELPEEKRETNAAWLMRELQDLKQSIWFVEQALTSDSTPGLLTPVRGYRVSTQNPKRRANDLVAKLQRVVIESPLGGDFQRNIRYAKLACLDALRRGEAPYASHLFYTHILNDATREERKLGMSCGFLWGEAGDTAAVYQDLGISPGMTEGINLARERGQTVVYRTLPADLRAKLDSQEELTKTDGM